MDGLPVESHSTPLKRFISSQSHGNDLSDDDLRDILNSFRLSY